MQWFIGTSGWSYPHWRGVFYPHGLPQRQWLAWYARQFRSVEINGSFYRLPSQDTLLAWKAATPDDFVFSLKASAFITHRKKLADPELGLPALLEVAHTLGEKLGPVLFQLPPRWHVNLPRLAAFLDALPPTLRYVFELRDPSWHCAAVYERLAARRIACCRFDLHGLASPQVCTADFAYVRLHGPDGPYGGLYGKARLEAWAERLAALPVQSIYCYFDNDQLGHAARDARAMQELVAIQHGQMAGQAALPHGQERIY